MLHKFLLLSAGLGWTMAGATFVQSHEKTPSKIKPVLAQDIVEKVSGKDAKATVVEVILQPGQAGEPHRHPGPVFGYVLEGVYEWAIDDQPSKVLKVGEAFYEPAGCLHRVSKNPAAKGQTRVLAWVIHPRDTKELAIPEKKR